MNPWRRLHLSTTLSYTESKLISAVNNGVELVPYRGDIYSVISSATFALNMKTTLHASYFFSQADYDQGGQPGGVPVGLTYARHGLLSGVTCKLQESLSMKLQYGWFNYSEPSTLHANDYNAHAVFAGLTWTLN